MASATQLNEPKSYQPRLGSQRGTKGPRVTFGDNWHLTQGFGIILMPHVCTARSLPQTIFWKQTTVVSPIVIQYIKHHENLVTPVIAQCFIFVTRELARYSRHNTLTASKMMAVFVLSRSKALYYTGTVLQFTVGAVLQVSKNNHTASFYPCLIPSQFWNRLSL